MKQVFYIRCFSKDNFKGSHDKQARLFEIKARFHYGGLTFLGGSFFKAVEHLTEDSVVN